MRLAWDYCCFKKLDNLSKEEIIKIINLYHEAVNSFESHCKDVQNAWNEHYKTCPERLMQEKNILLELIKKIDQEMSKMETKKLKWKKKHNIYEADGFQMYPVSLNFEILPDKDSFHLQLCSDKNCVGFDDYPTLEDAEFAAQRIIDQIAEHILQRDTNALLS